MSYWQCVVGRNVACAETRSAERALDIGAASDELSNRALLEKVVIYGRRRRIYAERKLTVTHRFVLKYSACFDDIIIRTACAACDNTLLYSHFAVDDLIRQLEVDFFIVEKVVTLLFNRRKNIHRIIYHILQVIYVGRMERQRDLRNDLWQVYFHNAVVICQLIRSNSRIVVHSASDCIIILDFNVVSRPYWRQTRRFRRHYVNADTVFYRQILDAFADKFHNFVFDKAALEHCAYNCKRNVLRSHALSRRAYEMNCDYVRILYIVRTAKKLFDKFRSAFADRHSA